MWASSSNSLYELLSFQRRWSPDFQSVGSVGDEQIEISDHLPMLTKTTPLLTKDPAYLVVHTQHSDAREKLRQFSMALVRFPGVVYTFVEFSQWDGA